MEETFRLFVGVTLSDAARAAVTDAQAALREDAPRVRWESPERLHITLAFLGATPAHRVDEIRARLREATALSVAHELTLRDVGAFPAPSRPSVIWIGVASEMDRLTAVQRDIAAALSAIGFTMETRPFHAHVTIGRVPRAASADVRRSAARALSAPLKVAPISWRAEGVALFRSYPDRAGAPYEAMALSPFNNKK